MRYIGEIVITTLFRDKKFRKICIFRRPAGFAA